MTQPSSEQSSPATASGPWPGNGLPAESQPPAHPRRWWGLAVLGLAQLMILLDGTIVNVALPSLQRDLGMADGDRPWVITSYTLAFGGLLLLAGRIADLVGRRRVFLAGLAGFAVASGAGGLAPTAGALFAARAFQGVFAALLAASALALITTTFSDPRERRRAIAVFGALGGTGGALGVTLGGVLTDGLGWRWCLYVNVPIALAALAGSVLMPPDTAPHRRGRLDLPGAILACGGLTALVYAFSAAKRYGWGAAPVLGPLAGGAVLLALFAVRQRRAAEPLLPPRLLRDRARVAALFAGGCLMAAQLSVSLFLTFHLQTVLGWSAARTGLGFLPLSVITTLTATQLGTRLLPRLGARVMMTAGLCIAALGLLRLSLITPDDGYATGVLPALAFFGIGMGTTFLALMTTATAQLPAEDAGIASAALNSAQQVGGSIGSAVFNTAAASAAAGFDGTSRAATLHGFATAAHWPLAGLLIAAVGTGLAARRTPSA
ncbi:MFS transporter [Streptomyces sp. SID8379]|uniref:MFS transporter n=1 Tax=unclassified Streptomyces TaxID=2593676 RepID=UPI0003682FE5|nr:MULTISPECIES: MFS transporter [unclassified Streptomyces]MYW69786.1 MFS transporter [Streptomyces sp. SID8379]